MDIFYSSSKFLYSDQLAYIVGFGIYWTYHL